MDGWQHTTLDFDPEGDGEWRLVATVNLEVAEIEGAPTLPMEHLGTF